VAAWVRGMTIERGVVGCGGCGRFDGFATKVCGDGLPSASVVAFREGEKEL
jgi:hypothetical protein